jgi:hypothetical protein
MHPPYHRRGQSESVPTPCSSKNVIINEPCLFKVAQSSRPSTSQSPNPLLKYFGLCLLLSDHIVILKLTDLDLNLHSASEDEADIDPDLEEAETSEPYGNSYKNKDSIPKSGTNRMASKPHLTRPPSPGLSPPKLPISDDSSATGTSLSATFLFIPSSQMRRR